VGAYREVSVFGVTDTDVHENGLTGGVAAQVIGARQRQVQVDGDVAGLREVPHRLGVPRAGAGTGPKVSLVPLGDGRRWEGVGGQHKTSIHTADVDKTISVDSWKGQSERTRKQERERERGKEKVGKTGEGAYARRLHTRHTKKWVRYHRK
jgi:hypothetical protein